jgi:hypothetical protein
VSKEWLEFGKALKTSLVLNKERNLINKKSFVFYKFKQQITKFNEISQNLMKFHKIS